MQSWSVTDQIIAWAKVPTTQDVYSGIVAALARLPDASTAARVHIGTTAFTNALLERRQLASAAAIRVGKPVSESLPPMTDWPDDLQAAVHNRSYFSGGGCEYDGRPISPLDRDEVTRIARELAQTRITQVAVTSVFGTPYPDDEVRVAEWMAAENPGLQERP
jgi:N-methylhydantoinase A/oxoprolinase/acetone carboxylase beta subunit